MVGRLRLRVRVWVKVRVWAKERVGVRAGGARVGVALGWGLVVGVRIKLRGRLGLGPGWGYQLYVCGPRGF